MAPDLLRMVAEHSLRTPRHLPADHQYNRFRSAPLDQLLKRLIDAGRVFGYLPYVCKGR
jgi:hypothetical protein